MDPMSKPECVSVFVTPHPGTTFASVTELAVQATRRATDGSTEQRVVLSIGPQGIQCAVEDYGGPTSTTYTLAPSELMDTIALLHARRTAQLPASFPVDQLHLVTTDAMEEDRTDHLIWSQASGAERDRVLEGLRGEGTRGAIYPPSYSYWWSPDRIVGLFLRLAVGTFEIRAGEVRLRQDPPARERNPRAADNVV